MNKIPTAEEFARREYGDDRDSSIFMERQIDMKHALWMMNIHAKHHVEAALKAASENAKTKRSDLMFDAKHYVDKESILNAYPLTNII